MKKLLSTSLVLLLMLGLAPYTRADWYDTEIARIVQLQRGLQRQVRQARNQPSRTAALRAEISELRNSIQNLRRQKVAEKRAQLTLQRKKLQPVSLPVVAAPVESSFAASESGKASYYADKFNGRSTASGEVFSNSLMTAAHKTLPFGTRVKVLNPHNGNTVEVTINDRGPYTPGRIIDLSSHAFSQLDSLSRGVIDVQIEVLD